MSISVSAPGPTWEKAGLLGVARGPGFLWGPGDFRHRQALPWSLWMKKGGRRQGCWVNITCYTKAQSSAPESSLEMSETSKESQSALQTQPEQAAAPQELRLSSGLLHGRAERFSGFHQRRKGEREREERGGRRRRRRRPSSSSSPPGASDKP